MVFIVFTQPSTLLVFRVVLCPALSETKLKATFTFLTAMTQTSSRSLSVAP